MSNQKVTFGTKGTPINIGTQGINANMNPGGPTTGYIINNGPGQNIPIGGQGFTVNNTTIGNSPGFNSVNQGQLGYPGAIQNQAIETRYVEAPRYETRIEGHQQPGMVYNQPQGEYIQSQVVQQVPMQPNVYRETTIQQPIQNVYRETVIQQPIQNVYRETAIQQQPIEVHRQEHRVIQQQVAVGGVQQVETHQEPRPVYQKLYSNGNDLQRKEASDIEPAEKTKCCSPCCWALWGLLGLIALTLGMLFGLGVIGGLNGPDLDLNAGGVDIDGGLANINGTAGAGGAGGEDQFVVVEETTTLKTGSQEANGTVPSASESTSTIDNGKGGIGGISVTDSSTQTSTTEDANGTLPVSQTSTSETSEETATEETSTSENQNANGTVSVSETSQETQTEETSTSENQNANGTVSVSETSTTRQTSQTSEESIQNPNTGFQRRPVEIESSTSEGNSTAEEETSASENQAANGTIAGIQESSSLGNTSFQFPPSETTEEESQANVTMPESTETTEQEKEESSETPNTAFMFPPENSGNEANIDQEEGQTETVAPEESESKAVLVVEQEMMPNKQSKQANGTEAAKEAQTESGAVVIVEQVMSPNKQSKQANGTEASKEAQTESGAVLIVEQTMMPNNAQKQINGQEGEAEATKQVSREEASPIKPLTVEPTAVEPIKTNGTARTETDVETDGGDTEEKQANEQEKQPGVAPQVAVQSIEPMEVEPITVEQKEGQASNAQINANAADNVQNLENDENTQNQENHTTARKAKAGSHKGRQLHRLRTA